MQESLRNKSRSLVCLQITSSRVAQKNGLASALQAASQLANFAAPEGAKRSSGWLVYAARVTYGTCAYASSTGEASTVRAAPLENSAL